MKIKRHIVAGRMTSKALNKSPISWETGFVNTDIGSDDHWRSTAFKFPPHMPKHNCTPLPRSTNNIFKGMS
eukprot:181358-Pelagomonas_calceolata.AAC.1